MEVPGSSRIATDDAFRTELVHTAATHPTPRFPGHIMISTEPWAIHVACAVQVRWSDRVVRHTSRRRGSGVHWLGALGGQLPTRVGGGTGPLLVTHGDHLRWMFAPDAPPVMIWWPTRVSPVPKAPLSQRPRHPRTSAPWCGSRLGYWRGRIAPVVAHRRRMPSARSCSSSSSSVRISASRRCGIQCWRNARTR